MKVCLLLCLLHVCSACSGKRSARVPVGHIPSPKPITASEEEYGHTLLEAITKKHPLDYTHPRRAEVDRVMKRLTSAINASHMPWHVHVFTAPTVKNAAATKGNHIFIWTGMIDMTKNEDELAVVLAHEVSHILANHTESSSGEDITQILVNIGAFALGTAAAVATNGSIAAGTARDITSSLTREIGSGLFIYPYARDKEREADQIGLFLLKKAGYNPDAAISFWTRALKDPSFSASIEFFSTHPPAGDRLAELKDLVPLVKQNKPITLPQPKSAPTKTINPPAPSPQRRPDPSIMDAGDSFDRSQR